MYLLHICTNITQLGKIIKSIAPKTSSGSDNIPNLIIKQLPLSYMCILVKIFNHCLNIGYFPEPWKSATIIVIPKKRGIVELKDLRPISMTSNLGKILEAIILENIHKEMRPNTIPDHQFGFKMEHFTTDALAILNEKLVTDQESRTVTAVVSLDIRKAFDSVWHKGLIFKIANAGCLPATTKILKSFLEDRVATIKLDNNHSSTFSIERGVPQGTSMGPVLHNIYTADMNINIDRGGLLLQFADDTMVAHSSMSATHATRKVEKYCAQIDVYLSNWGIELNEDKTTFLTTKVKGKPDVPLDKTLVIKKKKISNSKNLKYLGVTFDKGLTFKTHGMNMAKKGRQATGAARMLLQNKMLNHKVKCTIYKMLIRPVSMHACPICANEKNLIFLERMERWAFRFALNLFKHKNKDGNTRFVKNEVLYEEMGIEPMRDFILNQCTVFSDRLKVPAQTRGVPGHLEVTVS